MKKDTLNNIVYSIDTIDVPLNILMDQMSRCSVYAFIGPLGAGKTTLVKQLLARLGVEEVISSPTYTYMAAYTNAQGQIFYHFDLYRIKSLKEFIEQGFDEYLYVPGSWAFIEWPEIIMPIINKKACYSFIDYHDTHERVLTYKLSEDL